MARFLRKGAAITKGSNRTQSSGRGGSTRNKAQSGSHQSNSSASIKAYYYKPGETKPGQIVEVPVSTK